MISPSHLSGLTIPNKSPWYLFLTLDKVRTKEFNLDQNVVLCTNGIGLSEHINVPNSGHLLGNTMHTLKINCLHKSNYYTICIGNMFNPTEYSNLQVK